MDNTTATTDRPKRRIKPFDLVIVIVVVLVSGILLKTLLNQLSTRHEASSAAEVTSQAIAAIRKHDGVTMRKLGDATFQRQNTAANLSAQFKSVSQLTKNPAVIDRETVTNTSAQQAASVIYKFPNKPVFYVRVIVVKSKDSGKWQVVNLNANTTEKPLLDNKY
jgi:type II secretory pathway pseudopilin PulG